MTELLIVDDHQLFLDGLQFILEKDDEFKVSLATSSTEALRLLSQSSYDLAIFDIQMPESVLNGVELTQQISTQYPNMKILVVSMDKSAQTVEELIAAGAHGYLIKDSGHSTLLDALKTLKSGKEYWDPKILQLMVDAQRDRAFENKGGSAKMPEVVLTSREKDVLRLLAEGLSSKEIADRLSIGTSTVDTHRKNMIAKFGAKNSTDVVVKANEQGLL